MRGIRGATTIACDKKEFVIDSVRLLLTKLVEENNLSTENIGAAIFSATDDIKSTFPAAAARTLPNWDFVPLFDTRQIDVSDSLKLCIRVLLLVDTDLPQNKIKHIYLNKARILRPDLCKKSTY